jgi:hypothetical protein
MNGNGDGDHTMRVRTTITYSLHHDLLLKAPIYGSPSSAIRDPTSQKTDAITLTTTCANATIAGCD